MGAVSSITVSVFSTLIIICPDRKCKRVQLNFLHFQTKGEADALFPAQTKHLLNVLVVRPITFLIGNVSSYHELLSF